MAALKYWVWLTTLPGLTEYNKLLLMEHFSSPEDIYYADQEVLWQVEGLGKEQAALLDNKSMAAADRILADCARKGIFLITMADALYPERLRNIYQPPLLLYGKGAMPLFDEEVAIAMVGTRDGTPYGIHCAEKLGYELAQQGGMVVSGMAKGIDAAAMRGALRAGGFTCGVLGGGVDVVYPAENRRLYEDIAATGVLLSEYPPQTRPEAWHFPVRNRILSGLSVAAVVVEAPAKSGALITAGNAVEQGREVFAVPGPIDAPNSAGCHQLIREGAGLVTCAWDILGEYESRYPHKLRRQQVSVPPPIMISSCQDRPAFLAAFFSCSLSAGLQMTLESLILMAGPWPRNTTWGCFSSVGVSSVPHTSQAMAISGRMPSAAVWAPRQPTSSCAENTKYRSYLLCFRRSMASSSTTQPMRSSA